MVQTAFCEKTTTPSVLGCPPLPEHDPVHVAWLLALTSHVVSGGAEAEHVPTLPAVQLNGACVTLPVPRIFRRSVT
jgi:hypothetical protein